MVDEDPLITVFRLHQFRRWTADAGISFGLVAHEIIDWVNVEGHGLSTPSQYSAYSVSVIGRCRRMRYPTFTLKALGTLRPQM